MRVRAKGWAALAWAAAAGACGGDAPPPEAAPAGAARAVAEGVQVEAELPDSLGWGQEGDARFTVANRGAGPAGGVRLRVFLEAGVQPVLADSGPGAPEVAAAGGGTTIVWPVGALAAGEARQVVQRVRLPAAPPAPDRGLGADTAPPHDRFLVRAGATDPSGRPLGPLRQDTLAVFQVVASVGCGANGPLPVMRYGAGGVRLGMTPAEVRALCPGVRDTAWRAEGTRETGLVVPFGRDTVVALLVGGRVARLLVADPDLRTAAGLGVGSTFGDLVGRYGRACAGVGEGRVAVWFANAPGISFGLSAPVPPEWRGGAQDATLLSDTATVTRLWVRQGEDDCPSAGGAR
jgi:hypothetical protein